MRVNQAEIDVGKLSALKAFSSFFKEGEAERLARQTGFIVRSSSRLTGEAFLKMTVHNIVARTEWSLSDQCACLQQEYGIELTKQSLDERYHTYSVAFIKHCYQYVLQQVLAEQLQEIPCSFSGIYLTDSTTFQLPAHLACFYQSNGGDTSGASVKIHQTVELLHFQVQDLKVCDGKQNDVNYWKQEGFAFGQNNLWIADLGHFSQGVFSRIAGSGSYFLSRYKAGTLLYRKTPDGSFAPLPMEDYLQELATQTGPSDIPVYFGPGKVPARLIGEVVSEPVKAQRLEYYRQLYLRQRYKEKHWEMTRTRKLLCGYNLYLTNAPGDKLQCQEVFSIYALRWQVELLFKIWKSLLFLDKVGQMNICRFECFLYGRLLFILLSTELTAFIKSTLRDLDLEVEISEWKTMKLLKKNSMPSSVPPSMENKSSVQYSLT